MAKQKPTTAASPTAGAIRKALNYVRGAIDAGQFVPLFKSYAIANGIMQGSDGVVTLNAPVALDCSLCVDANKFARAVMACSNEDEEVVIDFTATGNMRVRQGKFRAIVPVTSSNPEEFPWSEPEGDMIAVPSNLLTALRELRPFIGADATRPWAMGVLVRSGRLYATNNVLLTQSALVDAHWNDLDNVIIPTRAVDELLRVNVLPKGMLIAPDSLTFMHSRSWWMKVQLIKGEWPPVDIMINAAAAAATTQRISDELRAGIARLLPFAQGAAPLYLINGRLSTSRTDDDGAEIDGFEQVSISLSAEVFKLMLTVATHFDTSPYPKPIYFVGSQIAGIAACMTMESAGPPPTTFNGAETGRTSATAPNKSNTPKRAK